MNILLHVCCAPCTVFPLRVLRGQGHSVTGYFFNPNIHPYTEFTRRLTTLREYAAVETLELSVEEDYGLRDYLRQVVFQEDRRCAICYRMRLEQTARFAAASRADAFTTTLLYSRYQNHALIRETGEALAHQYGVVFWYDDFRRGWQEGIDQSIALGLYRQPYCGCIYSEQERYDRKMRKESKKNKQRTDGDNHAEYYRPGNQQHKQGQRNSGSAERGAGGDQVPGGLPSPAAGGRGQGDL
jgi:hypothetical protein